MQTPQSQEDIITPPTLYKSGIPLFRSLYSLLRILPVWRVFKRLKARVQASRTPPNSRMGNTAAPKKGTLGIMVRVKDPEEREREDGVLGFGEPLLACWYDY